MARLGKQPHQGALEPGLLPDIRYITKDRAIFYFTVDDTADVVTVLAIFFGAQDHQRAILRRIMGG
jgi:plasmid stabilization system protein ParE